MIWDLYQQRGIAEAKGSAAKAERKAESAQIDLERMNRQISRLTLACQSMWELVRERTDLTEEDLEKRVLEVDLRDGRADGKISAQVIDCRSCGKKTNTKRFNCVFCGAPVAETSQFDS